ncbi:MAG: endo-1,4-beta-xylanase [Treponema sp.]|nr:endo-1,4-beta-xylanase [Treponema sp.]
MKKSRFALLAVLPVILVIFASCMSPRTQGDADAQEAHALTIGSSINLFDMITDLDLTDKIIWSSNASDIAAVTENGIATALSFSDSVSGTGKAVITARDKNGDRETFSILTTMMGLVDMMELPPLKDQFSEFFMIGAIFHNGTSQGQGGFPSDVPSGATTVMNPRLIHHFNVLTHENEMKPASISTGRNSSTGVISYNWATADRMVNAALESGFKIVGHTLLWHSQIPEWQRQIASQPREVALAAMKQYITDVVGRYKGKIYAWDVINEALPNSMSDPGSWRTAMRSENPWFRSIGADFVYEGFLAARLADPAAILYYNDFNLNENGKATTVRNMVRDVNERYIREHGGTRPLIEGIGMQGHHNTGVSADSIRRSLNLFRPLGVKISISELDILSQGWGEYSPNRNPPTNNGKLRAANLYGEYFKVFLDNADIIERVTFWGVFDEQSWRRTGLPLLFEGSTTSRAKPAYYRIISELENR